MPLTKEQKEEAKDYVELIKKSKGSLKVYFAVAKGAEGDVVHLDKKKPNACVTALKAKKAGTILASGQVKFEDALTLYCLKEANENAVRKSFFHFFKEREVSIPGVTENKIIVLGPKDWDSAAEDEDAPQAASGDEPPAESPASATATAAPATTAAEPGPSQVPNQGPALVEAYKKLVPEMNQKVAARPELKDPLTKLAHILQEQLHATEFDKAAKTLEELTTLVHATGADATAPKLDPNELLAAYKKLVPEMNKKVAENPSLKEPFTQAARQFQEALQAGKLEIAKRTLEEIAGHLASKAQAEPAGAKADGLAQEFATRYEALKSRLAEAVREGRGDTSKMRAGTQFAIEKANQKDFATALKALEQLERLVEAAGAAAAKPAPYSAVARAKARMNFQAARRAVSAQVSALKTAMEKVQPEEADLAQETKDYLSELTEEIADAVDEAINAPGATDIDRIIQRYIAELDSHELVNLVDSNPLVKVDIRNTLTKALRELREAMPVTA